MSRSCWLLPQSSHNAWELKEEAGWLRQALDPPDLGQKQFPLDCQMELPYMNLLFYAIQGAQSKSYGD